MTSLKRKSQSSSPVSLCVVNWLTHGPVLIRIRYVAGELEMVPELDSDGNEIPLRHEL